MFDQSTYVSRRQVLSQQIGRGVILLPGHVDSPVNFAGNVYPFRQDSTFLYYFGLDIPGLAAVIDVDAGETTVFGDDPTVEQMVWTGGGRPLKAACEDVGVRATAARAGLAPILSRVRKQGRAVHFLPPYRAETVLQLSGWLELAPGRVAAAASEALIRAVFTQRALKSAAEIREIEAALDITCEMHLQAMRIARPGLRESQVVAAMQEILYRHGTNAAYGMIFTVRGEILHIRSHANTLRAGDLALNDSGAEGPSRYACDITRTFPVAGRFTPGQREIYEIVLQTLNSAVAAAGPGVKFLDLHLRASEHLFAGLKALGLTRGDPAEAVREGAHALFFPCGLGHMLGLDVHDMENLGEDFVGYDTEIRRSSQYGLKSLRLARSLQPGYVLTIEPGIYFMPAMIDLWRAEKRFLDFIDYSALEKFSGFGGIRIEEDVAITESGGRVLGPPIPKTIAAIEAAMGGKAK